MPKRESKNPYKDLDDQFKLLGRKVEIRTKGKQVEMVIDDQVHQIEFLKNGRPHTAAYVNVMATSVRDFAERFVKFTDAQEKHWRKVDAERKKQQACN